MTLALPVSRSPANLDFARPNVFQLSIFTIPQVSFFCQSVTLPGISLEAARQPTPLTNIPWPGEKITWSTLEIEFKVQSKFEDYIELYNWFIGIGSPTNNNEYTKWIDDHNWRTFHDGVRNTKTSTEQFSDATLIVLNGSNNPTVEFHFHNMFPTNLSGVAFSVSSGDATYLTAKATFVYQFFKPVPIA
jgi:hypothetical protein